ncbi:MAG: TRAP transporter substrate-binding protein DctP [Burkholderiaceae bacterium]|nr:TRAP transporter substrate-binding protein DctP [Burkholderiaceae bacterium]
MQRRDMLKKATIGAAATTTLAAPAIIQAQPTLNWRCASSFTKATDIVFGGAESIAKHVAEMSGGKFNIRVFGSGEIVPGLQVADAAMNNTIECGHTASYYYVGKDPVWAFGACVPFGLNFRQHNAWWIDGGGEELMQREFYDKQGIVALLAGNTGGQMGGWFNKEIRTPDDLKGLKFRIGGFAGQALAKLGVIGSQIAAGEIYQALERGTIDSAEWVGPYEDEKMGLHKVAKWYYYPGWWEPGPALSLMVGKKAWDSLPKAYQQMLRTASLEANVEMMARFDARNAAALKRLIAGGTRVAAFPKSVMDVCYKACQDLFTETGAKNPLFKKVFDHQTRFLSDSTGWLRLNEGAYDSYMGTIRR